ncbi:MAG: hypothetical protein V4447_10490 [Pseudomonadota bacterium]
MTTIQTKEIWIVWQNTDLTEGRGHSEPIAYCETEATAKRLSKGKGVQGSDADIKSFEAIKHKGIWCAPIMITVPTVEDKRAQDSIELKRGVLNKARAAGLSDDDIKILAGVKL